MIKKILNSSFWNLGSATINFALNYFIVRWLNLSILGEFTIYTSSITLASLVFSLIPPNYSLFKYQDDSKYKILLVNYFIFCSIIYSTILLVFNLTGLVKISFFISLLYSLPLQLQNFFDIKLQAENKIGYYFRLLFIVALFKFLIMALAHYLGVMHNFETLILYSSIAQVIVIFYLFLGLLKNTEYTNNFKLDIKSVTKYLVENFKNFKSYYVNAALKKARESTLVLLYAPFVNKEVMGLFSLFIKIDVFVLSLTRNIEAFFLNKKNLETYKDSFNKKYWLMGLFFQVFYFVVGTVYMKVMTNEFYFIIILVQSVLVFPHIKYLYKRAQMLSEYSNTEANISEILFCLVVIISFLISFKFNLFTIYYMVIAYIVSKAALQAYMIFGGNKTSKIIQTN